MTLRPACISDYAVIASWITNADACARWAGPQLPYPFDTNALPALLAKPESISLALMDEFGAVIGFAQYWRRDDRRVHIGRIIVSPMSRGKGWGRVLCEKLIVSALTGTGLPIVSLRVYRNNLAAQTLYRQLGFIDVPGDSNAEVLAMEYHSNVIKQSPEHSIA